MKIFLKDFLGWGFILWLFGYVLGFILFFIIPPSIIGWVITPIGVAVTLLVLHKKISQSSIQSYFLLGVCWVTIAVLCDYVFMVKLLHPVDGYYKLDVYMYYVLTFLLPIGIGIKKLQTKTKTR